MKNNIFRIVLSGGVCSGKSSSLSHISDRLRSLGFDVFIIPEVATLMILGGISLVRENPEHTMQIQTSLLQTQLHLEQHYYKIAKLSGKPSVIICDRGTMDGSAFISPDMWQAILDENGWSTVGLRDKHYDAVIHLVTAAIGAREFYTLENNAARTETPEQAAEMDGKIQNVWIGHPHLRVIDNSTDFAGKLKRVCAVICNVIGVPEPVEHERKFLVKINNANNFDNLKYEKIEIEQTYLKAKDGSVPRIRKRGQNGSFTYTYTIKKYLGDGKNIEKERMISSREYLNFLPLSDKNYQSIKKIRYCFLYKNQYFELDEFKNPKNLSILEAEIDEDSSKIELPPFLEIEKEVTDDLMYSNVNIAKGLT